MNLSQQSLPKISAMNSTQQSVDSEDPPESQWVCQLYIAEGIVGVLGNLLVCFVILRVKFLHNMTNYLLVNLAVADMLLCLELISFGLINGDCKLIDYVPKSFGERIIICHFLHSEYLPYALSYASAYNLCAITLERYVAIVHPLQYVRKLTATRMKTMIAMIWITSFLLTVPLIFTMEPSDDPDQACSKTNYQVFRILIGVLTFLLTYLLPVTLMSLAYYKMQVTLKRQVKALKLQHARAAAYDLVTARQRLLSMLTIVLGALIILWTPTQTYLLCLHATENGLSNFCASKDYQYFDAICAIMFIFNSVINPIIYGFKYKKFRQGFKTALCCCFNNKSNNRVDIGMAPQ